MKLLAFLTIFVLFWSVDAKAKSPQETACSLVPDKTYIADPENEKKFYKCENGKPIPGTFIDPTKIVCRGEQKGKVANPSECKKYYTCSKEKVTGDPEQCPKETPNFDANIRECVADKMYECPAKNHCALISNNFFTPHPNTKKPGSYILCMNTIALYGECREGFGYNQMLGVCDYGHKDPNFIICDNDIDTPVPNKCSQYYSCKNKEELTTCPQKQHFYFPNLNCVDAFSMDPPCEYDRCENMPNGWYIPVENTQCTKYYYCVDGKVSNNMGVECPKEYPYLNEEFQHCVKERP
uniref:Chitin-binding type-2 domain-containing protein n=1 Tax=Megaselia scalaris TaxID=36166 RepID=T1GDM7_MEGSC